MRIDEILAFNERFVEQTHLPTIGHAPRKQMALVTCMDCRLVQMFEQALGLERGDVLELRTAGATISEEEREDGANDLHANSTALIASMQALGVDPQKLIEQEELGDMQGLLRWLGAFNDVHVNIREVVNVIRRSPYLPRIPVHGLVIDIITGKLEMVDRG